MEVRVLEDRQILGGVVSAVGGAVSGVVGGVTSVVGGVTSVVGDVTSGLGSALSLPTATTTSTDTSTSVPTSTSSSSSTLSTSSTSSSSVSSSSSSISSSSSTTLSIPPTTSGTSTIPLETTSNNPVTHTVFESTAVAASISPSASESSVAAPATKGFLQNKPLAGFVFALVGIVTLIIIFIGATWAVRRRRNKRLLDQAISFDPTVHPEQYEDNAAEKGRISYGSASAESHGTYFQNPTYPANNPTYYRDNAGGQQPFATYAPPSQMTGGQGMYGR